MAGQNREVPRYLSAVSLAEDSEGEWIDVRDLISGAFFLAWSDAAATDAVVKVQESGDKTNAKDVTGKAVTIAAASGADVIKLTAADLQLPWIRLVIVDNTESAGTVTAGYFFKGNR
jgi:hypothetical protein